MCLAAFCAVQGVSLALSLHAPNQELRKQIVPSARAYPLHRLFAAIEEYQAATQQRVFVEYVMLAGGWLGVILLFKDVHHSTIQPPHLRCMTDSHWTALDQTLQLPPV